MVKPRQTDWGPEGAAVPGQPVGLGWPSEPSSLCTSVQGPGTPLWRPCRGTHNAPFHPDALLKQTSRGEAWERRELSLQLLSGT